jgi:hypothetical protein
MDVAYLESSFQALRRRTSTRAVLSDGEPCGVRFSMDIHTQNGVSFVARLVVVDSMRDTVVHVHIAGDDQIRSQPQP